MSFDALGLAPELLRAVREQEYQTPTPVQTQAIPAVLAGRDLMAAAQTGSGKTAGFTLPMLQRLHTTSPVHAAAGNSASVPGHHRVISPRKPRALVLVPTRELCAQVEESVRAYGAYLPLRSAKIFGGVGMQPQVDALRAGIDIVIATPGRLLDHVGRRTIDLSGIEILVLDEADRMLDMGFIHDIKRILALLPKQRQNLLFSATFADEIRELADRLLDRPQMIEVTPRNRPVELIAQSMYRIDATRKPDLLVHFFHALELTQVLVFTRTKHGANRLAEKLEKAGITAAAIHGNKSQNARTRALDDFKNNRVRALVATDIAARGLDIEGLPQVVNYEIPHVPEDYVHRIGRTGRAGAEGNAMSFVAADEQAQWRAIERLIGRAVTPSALPDLPPPTRAAAEPVREQSRPQTRMPGRGQQQSRGAGGDARRNSASSDSPQRAAQGARASGGGAPRGDERRQGPQTHRAPQPDRAPSGGNSQGGSAPRAASAGGPSRNGANPRGAPRGDSSRPARNGDRDRRGGADARRGPPRDDTARPGIETKRYVGAQVVFSSSTPRSRSR